MTELGFYLTPLCVGLAVGLVRELLPQHDYRVPANDSRPAKLVTAPAGVIAFEPQARAS